MGDKVKAYLASLNAFANLYWKIILLLGLSILWTIHMDTVEQYPVLEILAELVLTYLFLNLIFNYGRLVINYVYRKRHNYAKDYYDNFTLGIDRISFFLNHAIYALFVVNLFVNIRDLVTGLSLIAVALVLIFKEYISNLLNGITMMFSSEYKLKEVVKIGEHKGRIINISFQNLELKNEQGDIVFIPNNAIFTKDMINYSRNPNKNIRFDVNLPLSAFRNYITIKKKLTQKLLEDYEGLFTAESQILMRIDRMEKDSFQVIIELAVSRYNFRQETEIKNFCFEYVASLMAKEQKPQK